MAIRMPVICCIAAIGIGANALYTSRNLRELLISSSIVSRRAHRSQRRGHAQRGGIAMSSPQGSNAAMATDQQRQDSEQLQQLGYHQELHRTMSLFSNFAVTFSFISVTTGIFALFAVGLGTGGPAFIWSWPIVFFGQLL